MDGIVIRQMTSEHQDAVNVIAHASFNIAPGSGAVLPRWDDPAMAYFVACRSPRSGSEARSSGERVAGFMGLWMMGDEIHLSSIAVDPAFRQCGIALALMLHAIHCGRKCAATRMTLEVRRPNAPARSLYHKLGFVTAGCRPRYYLDNADDGIIMWIEDLHAPECYFRTRSLDRTNRALSHAEGTLSRS